MTLSPSEARAAAARVAKWLLDKGRSEEALALTAAWAARGPNDAAGQELLATALRIDSGSALAKLAFARMEGIDIDSGPLDEAMARFDVDALERLEAQMSRPAFLRAQVGFNNNIKFRGQVFHVQTEDSGLDKPHIITHLFADGGRVIKSHKRSYADAVDRPDVAHHVRSLMKGQHLEMAMLLRDGAFDEVLAGRAVGGMQVLEGPPKADVQKLATQKKQRVKAISSEPPAPTAVVAPAVAPPSVAPPESVYVKLHVMRAFGGGPLVYAPPGREIVIGSLGAVNLPGEAFCHPREACVRAKEGQLWLCDLEGGNGVFLRIRAPVILDDGDEFIIGDQLLRVERNPPPSDGPAEGPTYFASSPQWVSSFRVVQVFVGGALGACVLARGTTLVIGSIFGDFILPGDPLISEQHCFIEEQAGDILLTDYASRTGVFVRIKGEQELLDGDEIIVGRTRLCVQRC